MNDKLGMVYRNADGTIKTEVLDSVLGMAMIDSLVEHYGLERFTDTDMVMAQGASGAYTAAYDLSSPIGRLRYSNYRILSNR